MRLFSGSLLAIFVAAAALAQPTAKPLEFEVASIKPADPDARKVSLSSDRAGGLNATNIILTSLITAAYDIRVFQLSGGPGWIGTDRYNIIAKTGITDGVAEAAGSGPMTDRQRSVRDAQWKERVRSLLADRFGLVVHREKRVREIYILTVAKNGPKLQEVTTPGEPKGTTRGPGRTQGFEANMEMLTRTLAQATGRPVVDKTGLTGKYNYVLEWSPDVALDNSGVPDASQPVESSGPSIFTALQEQLGLKLESAKGPVDTIVIDHVEHPSPN